jgi:hypothetical protein
MRNPIVPFLLLNAAGALASAATDADCAKAQAGLPKGVAGVLCFASGDLTTANPATTPPDDSLTGLPPGAFLARTDSANQASVSPLGRYAVTKRVSGVQLAGAMAANSGARWVIRIPDDWNGRLIVAVAAGTRSEYQADLSVSDYAVQNGYAYAATNKGHLARRATTPDDPLGCPGSPTGGPGAASGFIAKFPLIMRGEAQASDRDLELIKRRCRIARQ